MPSGSRRSIVSLVLLALSAGFVKAQDAVEIDCAAYDFPHDSFAQSDVNKVYMSVDKVGAGPFKDVGLTQYTTVFGVRVLGHKTVPEEKIKHTANLLAQMMDANQDGKVDKPKVQEALLGRYASLIIVGDETFTNYLLSETEGEGLPKELKFCPFSIDFEEMTKIQPGAAPESVCPEDLFEKDRSLAFVSDHLIGRSWPMYVAEEFENHRDSPKYKKLDTMFKKAVADKMFDIEKTGCPADDSAEECALVMFASWVASTSMGMDRCYCQAVGAWKLCDAAAAKEKYPELVKFMEEILEQNGLPDGLYQPKDTSVLVFAGLDDNTAEL